MATLQQKIVTHLWFDTDAKEAAQFYCSIFPDSSITQVSLLKDTPSGDCELVSFVLAGQEFMALSAGPYFKFNEAISFVVYCDSQEEIDYYWDKLSAVPEAEQCGWIKDKFGVSWQIIPLLMKEIFAANKPAQQERLLRAVLTMKKLDLAILRGLIG